MYPLAPLEFVSYRQGDPAEELPVTNTFAGAETAGMAAAFN